MRRGAAWLLAAWALVGSAQAERFDPQTGRPVEVVPPAARQGNRMDVDPVLLKRAEALNAEGRTMVGEWIVKHVFGRQMRPLEINAVGREALRSVFEAPDRANVMWTEDGIVYARMESPSLGAGILFKGGEFSAITYRIDGPKAGKSPLRLMAYAAEHYSGSLRPGELQAYYELMLDTVMRSPNRMNQLFVDAKGVNYFRMEAPEAGLGMLYRISPKMRQLIRENVKPKGHVSEAHLKNLGIQRLAEDGGWRNFPQLEGEPFGPRASPGQMEIFQRTVREIEGAGSAAALEKGHNGGAESGRFAAGELMGRLADTAEWIGFKKTAGLLRDRMYDAELAELPKARRTGLPERSRTESSLKGQMTNQEWDGLRKISIEIGKDIAVTGSLSETDLGMARRYALDLNPTRSQEFRIPDWRARKNHSALIDEGKGDLDIWEGSNLTAAEKNRILKDVFPNIKEMDNGYSLKLYPDIESLSMDGGPGAIVFRSDGRVERIFSSWQREH